MSRNYRGFTIGHDPPPVPSRAADWQYVHDDYDGPPDDRHGHAASEQACRDEIDAWHDEQRAELDAAIVKVLDGFDEGVFVRNIDGDTEPGWAVKLSPYLAAIGVLARAVEDLRSSSEPTVPKRQA